MTARDRVSIVVYAGASGLVLPPTPGDQHATILAALDHLLPAADKAGLMPTLDARVMSLACARLAADPALRISVNCARVSISAADWIESFTASVSATPGVGARLIVEVTETGEKIVHLKPPIMASRSR